MLIVTIQREHGVFVVNSQMRRLYSEKHNEITAGLAKVSATICTTAAFREHSDYITVWGIDLHLGSMCGHELGYYSLYVMQL